jgi:PhnB protein
VSKLENQFYGDRAGCVKEPTGNMIWIATHVEDVPRDELRRRADKVMQAKG